MQRSQPPSVEADFWHKYRGVRYNYDQYESWDERARIVFGNSSLRNSHVLDLAVCACVCLCVCVRARARACARASYISISRVGMCADVNNVYETKYMSHGTSRPASQDSFHPLGDMTDSQNSRRCQEPCATPGGGWVWGGALYV